ncbi:MULTISPECIES: glycoside hydrolase family 97 protein [unclassified Dysgonomonas]|uniref:glycoside hydrolase family 97 protein n=1 Tax=unclassified Dysgonomonas TaxID=2630389 RepID=UPI0025B98D14|nr:MULTISPECIES: glycoside hydrolase family 97 protein [unclassified Dysgonomonas]HMM04511.1 glycoside hydrolase family 97 protein [Dysgonomonas sp.]
MRKNNSVILSLFCLLFCYTMTVSAQKQFTLKSPNGKLETSISVGKTVEYSVSHEGDIMLSRSPVSITLADGSAFGINARLSGSSEKAVNQTIDASVYKRNKIADNYNELTLKFKGDYNIIFRAYNDGIAYRFVSTSKKPFIIENEQAEFNFPADQKVFVAYANKPETTPLEGQFSNSFEQPYHNIALSAWNKKRLGISPLVVEGAKGKKVCITEADLMDYPGMFLYPAETANGLKGVFAPYPKDTRQGGHNELQILVDSRESFIAKSDGLTNFPWRVIIVAEKDSELADSDMVYKLATPSQGDYSWVKPGKVAWDWWNDWNLYGVDFRAGINNETYKYYIDFASKYGIEYVILDEGWAVNKKADLFQVIPEINLPELVSYAKAKNVDLILWAGYHAFDRDLEKVCKHYSEMGIKGFKVDFMDRDDQIMVDFHRRAAEMGAKYKVLIDFHGTYKPTGLQRTYPNVINFEGVNGLEQLKWSGPELDQVTYDVTIPFIRQVAGPMDYTQGAMRNATKGNYRNVYNEAMSQGTRCRQLAGYIIFESPLNMLCDSPSNYMSEQECTEFIAAVPTVWDNTISLDGEIGKYVSVARQKDNTWYVGAMTNWDARNMQLDLSFLGEGNFKGEVFKDGINADRAARDYKKETIDIPANKQLQVSMAPGGGYIIKITRK